MPLTLIRRRHNVDIDEHWIRADTWEQLATVIGMTFPSATLDGEMTITWPDGRIEHCDADQAPSLPDLVRTWASHGYRWAVISGKAPTPRAVHGADQAFEEL